MNNTVQIEVTTKCNLKCLNCFAHANSSELGDMSQYLAYEILEEAAELGFRQLSITGGEPFLWPYIIDLLDLAEKLKFTYILINSNGHLLSNELCKKLEQYGEKLEISCSLNGFIDEHERTRGSGSFNSTILGIETALLHNLNIHIYSVIDRKNLKTLPYFTDFILKKYPGVRNLVFIQLRGINDDYYKVEDLKLEPEEFIEMVKMVAYLSLAGKPVQILENSLSTVVANEFGFRWLPTSPDITISGKIVVLQNGVITVNHSSMKSLSTYQHNSLKSALSSDTYIKYTEEESKLCLECHFSDKCQQAGKIRPSSRYHNTGNESIPFCRKVLELIK